jgi:predicted RNA binding protein YcfA (HicA-like mRNA interferase family)
MLVYKDAVPPLPVVTGEECVRALGKFGYAVARRRGSHVRLVCDGRSAVTVPVHRGRSLKRGTLSAILRVAELTVEEFQEALRA